MLASVRGKHNKKSWSLFKQVFSDSESMESILSFNFNDKIKKKQSNKVFQVALSLDTSNGELPTFGNVLIKAQTKFNKFK